MASSPEQEIPQEVVDKAFEWTLDGGCIGIMDIGDPYYKDLRREIITGLLAAVLPDLQRPLLEEIERERETRKALAQIADRRRAERGARPDFTTEEIRALLDSLLGYLKLIPFSDEQWERRPALKSARAKLEKSLDV